MKRNFFYSLLVVVAAMFATACSSDEDKTLEGVPGTYQGRTLAVTVNGTLVDTPDMSVTVSGDDRNAMTLVANNIILGQAVYTVPDVQFRVDEYDARVFAGDGSTDCNTVTITGKISNGKMALSVTQAGVTGEYSAQAGSASVTLNGKPVADAAVVRLEGTKTADMKLVLENVVLGADEFTISSLTLAPSTMASAQTRDASAGYVPYTFSGSARDSYREVSVSGRIDGAGLTAEVTVKNLGDMVGKWKIATDAELGTTLMMEVQGPSQVTFMGSEMSTEEFVLGIRQLVGMFAATYLEALQYIDFRQDGDVALLVHDPQNDGAPIEIPNEMIPQGAIRWYMDNGKVMFVVDAAMIEMIPGGYGDMIKGFFEVKNGSMYVPLNFKKTAGGVSVYLDKAFIKKALETVKPILADVELDPELKGLIDMILGELEVILGQSTTFNVGLDLTKL